MRYSHFRPKKVPVSIHADPTLSSWTYFLYNEQKRISKARAFFIMKQLPYIWTPVFHVLHFQTQTILNMWNISKFILKYTEIM